MSIITLTTDFGAGSPYVAAMKGAILSINPEATLVDVTHDVPAQDVRSGAIVLDDVTPQFPEGSIHVAVIDPGVGTARAIAYAEIGGRRYVAPDNGLLSRLAEKTEPTRLIRLENPEFWQEEVSSTFHGRDIMAPAAAHLSLGVDPARLGPPLMYLTELDWPEVSVKSNRIDGQVIEVDSFGNLVTNITIEQIGSRPTDESVCIACNIYETWGIYSAYAELPSGMLIALIDSNGRLELAVVGDSASRLLGIEVGQPVVAAWE